MLSESAPTLRQMTVQDLPAAWQLSKTLQWPHRLTDWAMSYRLSDAYVIDDNGKVVGSALICNQGDYTTIGLVIVADSHQGRGLGRQLMQHCLDTASSPNILLNATAEGLALYQRMGFKSYGSVYQYQTAALTPPAAIQLAPGTQVRPATSADTESIVALADCATAMARGNVLAELIQHQLHSWVIEGESGVTGFAITRMFGHGFAIGPVVAKSPQDAWTLISHAMQPLAGRFVRIDFPATAGLKEPVELAGLRQVSQVEQMVLGVEPITSGPIYQFALSNQALG